MISCGGFDMSMKRQPVTLGPTWRGRARWRFRLWAPYAKRVELLLRSPPRKVVAMRQQEHGYHQAVVEDIELGTRYHYRLDGQLELPDPASRSQPDGVHGASEVVPPGFAWRDAGWSGVPLRDFVLYELHVGTFTPAGTLEAVIPHLPELRKLGVSALELMPVAQFPGSRNWGYDGVYPYAVQNSYGGPSGLKRLVNAAHQAGLAIVLDVVYNHLGPEGNHLGEFGPYFTGSHRTPWGRALNFDGRSNHGCAASLLRTRCIGRRSFISTPCDSTPSRPFAILRPHLFYRNWRAPATARRTRLDAHSISSAKVVWTWCAISLRAPRRERVWTRSGGMIFTTACTRCSRVSRRVTTPALEV